uniref:tetratricopeptide repeat protein n=1 Tax=Acetatifactor sp. TaxID=1872090 RepID=UPI0040579E0E
MNKIEIFQVLGIEPTKEEQAIKNAYREKLSVTNPEDNPEGFKRLRTAFEEACRLAKEPEYGEGTVEEKDETPSGLWVAKAAEIYADITKRRDVEQWKELFAEDIFFSLEEEENCRLKFVRFLMEHYKLPTDVWKIFDEKLNIVKDMARLRESFPADFISFIASKCERGEDVEFEQFEGEPTAPYDLFLQYYEQCYRALDAGELSQAEELIKNADGLHIFHPVMEVCRAELLEKRGNSAEGITILKAMKERFPKDMMVCYNYAEILWRNDQKADAATVYEELKADNDSHYMANVRLSEWYYEQKCYQDAKKCAEKVLAHGGDEHFMENLKNINHQLELELEEKYRREKDYESGLELGWCYLQDGKVCKGIRLAENLSDKIPEERDSEHKGLLTKLYIEETEYEKTLAMSEQWEKALQKRLESEEPEEDKEKDRDRLRQCHVIRMHSYRGLGDMKDEYSWGERIAYYNKAIEESEKIEDQTSRDIGLLLEKAQIYMEMEEYEKCLEVTQKLIVDYQVYAAYATDAEAYRRQWNAGGVIQASRQCIHYFPNYIRAYEHSAKVYLDLERKEDLLNVLKEAEEKGIQSVLLEAYRYQMDHEIPETEELNQKLDDFRKEYFSNVEKGKLEYYEKGLPIITEYLYWYPGPYMLVERALFHRAAHHYQEAIEDFEKALAERPNQQYALFGLGITYKLMGDYEKALIYMKRAVRYRDKDMSVLIFADQGEVYSLLGDVWNARKSYEEMLRVDTRATRYRYHMKKYAMCVAACGEVEKAIDIVKDAYKDVVYEYYDVATDIYQLTGESKKAKALLLEWKQKIAMSKEAVDKDTYVDYYCRAAWHELMYGDAKQALLYFEKELESKGNEDSKGVLCDTTFAAILVGDDARGKKYAAKLREYREKEAREGKNYYYTQEKGRLHMNLLADYYTLSEEELDRLLSTEKSCEICHFCTWCICREVEANRLLIMLRKGQKEAVMERIARNLEEQPLDEYMIAILHMCENGVKVTPYRQADKDISNGVNRSDAAKSTDSRTGFLGRISEIFGKRK